VLIIEPEAARRSMVSLATECMPDLQRHTSISGPIAQLVMVSNRQVTTKPRLNFA
jgi:hypothetical protein